MSEDPESAKITILLLLLACLPLAYAYKSYLRVKFSHAFGFIIGAIVIAWLVNLSGIRSSPPAVPKAMYAYELLGVTRFGFFLALVPLCVRLVRAWLYDDLTAEERKGGADGVKAWLSFPNLLMAGLIVFCGWYAYGHSAWALAIFSLLALVARPLIAGTQDEQSTPEKLQEEGGESLKGERERVLRMLEEGAIQADDAAELLSALAATNPAPARQAESPPMTSKQRLAFGGALLVLLGFLLPWFSINLSGELERAAGQLDMDSVFQNVLGNKSGFPNIEAMPDFGSFKIEKNIRVSGAEIGKALGWLVLLCGAAAAFLTVVPQMMNDASLRRMLIAGALFVGAAVLLYLLGTNIRHVSYGIAVVVAGYAAIGTGAAAALRGQS